MVMRSGLRLGREDVLAYARATIDLIVQVGRGEGRRGVQQVTVPGAALAAPPPVPAPAA